MPTFNGFEEINAWKKAHQTCIAIYEITNDTALKRDFGLRDQMRRAAVSITSNIAEGHDRGSAAQFIYFLNVSRGSCAEVRSQLILAKDLNYITTNDLLVINQGLIEINKMIAGLIKYLKTTRK